MVMVVMCGGEGLGGNFTRDVFWVDCSYLK